MASYFLGHGVLRELEKILSRGTEMRKQFLSQQQFLPSRHRFAVFILVRRRGRKGGEGEECLVGKYLKGKDTHTRIRARVNTHDWRGQSVCIVVEEDRVSFWPREFRLEMDWNRRSVPSNRTRGSREGSDRKLALIRRPRFCSL